VPEATVRRRYDRSIQNFLVHYQMSKTSKHLLSLPLEKRAEIAFKAAVAKAIDENARLGLPVYVGRDGKVIQLSPDELRELSRSTQGK